MYTSGVFLQTPKNCREPRTSPYRDNAQRIVRKGAGSKCYRVGATRHAFPPRIARHTGRCAIREGEDALAARLLRVFFLIVIYGNRIQILGLEYLTAIEAPDIIHAVTAI